MDTMNFFKYLIPEKEIFLNGNVYILLTNAEWLKFLSGDILVWAALNKFNINLHQYRIH